MNGSNGVAVLHAPPEVAVLATPQIPLTSNELLRPPEDKIWELQCQYWKHKLLSIVIVVAFIIICAAALWWASFYAVESVPFVILGSTLLFPVVHTNLYHPHSFEAACYWQMCDFEKRVAQKITEIKTQSLDLLQEFRNIGANPQVGVVGQLTPILARYKVHDEIADRCWQAAPEINGLPSIYDRFKFENDYLTQRIQATFCIYVANHPHQYGLREYSGTFCPPDITTHLIKRIYCNSHDTPFFVFRNNTSLLREASLRGYRTDTPQANQTIARIFKDNNP